MEPVEVAAALQVATQILGLVQSALAQGNTTIPAADYNASVQARNSGLQQLDTDIAAQGG